MEYVTEERYWDGLRQMATDLKVELSSRPTDVDVTVDIGPGATVAVAALCMAFLAWLLFRLIREV